MAKEKTLTKSAALTPTADQTGSTINICDPDWFDQRESFKILNPSKAAADLSFTGDDLNYLARVLFAEASGSGSIKDEATRIKEKLAIVHVFYNRLNVIGFDPNSWTKGKFTTFKGVATAVKALPSGGYSGVQFEKPTARTLTNASQPFAASSLKGRKATLISTTSVRQEKACHPKASKSSAAIGSGK